MGGWRWGGLWGGGPIRIAAINFFRGGGPLAKFLKWHFMCPTHPWNRVSKTIRIAALIFPAGAGPSQNFLIAILRPQLALEIGWWTFSIAALIFPRGRIPREILKIAFHHPNYPKMGYGAICIALGIRSEQFSPLRTGCGWLTLNLFRFGNVSWSLESGV